ncbi:MAG: NAD(P)-dependent oxidoreductase [Candidatus Daviesbacteria bacterium]|nr:NAD(P)-dependent oxidoreductase [Candidatus Daviesbacteria bacterium]
MKVLIVGASGFLGRSIVKKALILKWDVWGTYNKNPNFIPDGCKKISIQDLNKLDDGYNLVYIAVGNFTLNQEDLSYANKEIPTQIIQKFKSSKIIFISSISIHDPTPYGLAKLEGELIVSRHKKYAIIRFTNLYGIGMNKKSFIPKIIKDAIAKKVITLTNKGERIHDYLYIDDAADLCIKAGLKTGNKIYLGATGKMVSNLKIAKIIQRLIPDCQIIFSGKDSAPSYSFNPKDTMKKLSWLPQKKIEDGIKELVKHYESISI